MITEILAGALMALFAFLVFHFAAELADRLRIVARDRASRVAAGEYPVQVMGSSRTWTGSLRREAVNVGRLIAINVFAVLMGIALWALVHMKAFTK